jgi:hypothetical protein
MEIRNIDQHETLRHAADVSMQVECASQALSNAVKNFTPISPVTPKFSSQCLTVETNGVETIIHFAEPFD